MIRTVYQYNAFSHAPDKGNPAGIVFDADDLTSVQMQAIAQHMSFNETAFVLKSSLADLQLRFFTPGHEMALCGHGTIAACFALAMRGIFEPQNAPLSITIETQAGILPITIAESIEHVLVSMRQAPARFVPFHGSLNDVATVLGILPRDIDSRYPMVYGSTGIWTLLVPVASLETFNRMEPQNSLFPSFLLQFPRASIHPFCLETYDPSAQMHGRHFSSPFSGTKEDPVTGTASGVMGAYYTEYIRPTSRVELMIEQGFEIKRDGRVQVSIERTPSTIEVTIAGVATYVAEWQYIQ